MRSGPDGYVWFGGSTRAPARRICLAARRPARDAGHVPGHTRSHDHAATGRAAPRERERELQMRLAEVLQERRAGVLRRGGGGCGAGARMELREVRLGSTFLYWRPGRNNGF